nr:hypothetical protein [Pseudomonas benzenivorans]
MQDEQSFLSPQNHRTAASPPRQAPGPSNSAKAFRVLVCILLTCGDNSRLLHGLAGGLAEGHAGDGGKAWLITRFAAIEAIGIEVKAEETQAFQVAQLSAATR